MRTALKVFAIIGIIIGGLAIFGGIAYPDDETAFALIGGGLFLTQGIITLCYIKEQDKKEEK